jgi:hypothetical protein
MRYARFLIFVFMLGLMIFTVSSTNTSTAADTKADDVVNQHLNAIGPATARATTRPRIAVGMAKMRLRSSGISEAAGNAVLASQGNKSMLTMKFGVPEYPYEKLGYDGKEVTAYAIRPGVYSTLGGFARTYSTILKEGLLGGTLSSAWPLLDMSNRKVKLEHAGTKKINSRQAIELRYEPRGGSDLSISLYFDAETHQHIRTVYKITVSARLGTGGVDSSSQQSESRYELIEDFSDFRSEGGLSLPHTYEIQYRFSGAQSRYFNWSIVLQSFVFDSPIEAKDFNVAN